MVGTFSGNGTAKLLKVRRMEVRNPFVLHHVFRSFYNETSNNETIKYVHQTRRRSSHTTMHGLTVQQHPFRQRLGSQGNDSRLSIVNFLNLGPNVYVEDESLLHGNQDDNTNTNTNTNTTNGVRREDTDTADHPRMIQSSLVVMIVSLITVPMTIAIVIQTLVNILHLYNSLPDLIRIIQDVSINTELATIFTLTQLRATYASELLSIPLRDLYVLSRMSSWLFMGAVPLAPSVTAMVTTAESCKNFANPAFCPALFEANPATTCDCAWKDPRNSNSCSNYAFAEESRRKQRVFFEGLSEDASTNGDRNTTSYPAVASSPGTTAFWSSMTSTPGSEDGTNSAGRDTTFGRLRLLSALSMIQIPLFNYAIQTDFPRTWTTELAIDVDGMVSGYSGCNYDRHSTFSQVRQTDENFAANPALCPVGKYG